MVTVSGVGFGIILAALLLCLTNLLYTVLDGHTGKPQNRVFIVILLLLFVNAVSELVNLRLESMTALSDRNFSLFRFSQTVYFLSHNLIAPMLYYYISFVVGRSVGIIPSMKADSRAGTTRRHFFPLLSVLISEIVIATNFLTEWCWTYSADGRFQRAWGEYVFIYLPAAIWAISAFILFMLSLNTLSKGRKRSIAICFLLACTGVVIQLLCHDWRIEVLMEALGFSGALLFIENEDDRRNVELNAYNSAAFSLDLTAAVRNKVPVKVLIIRDIDFDCTSNTIISAKIGRDEVSQAVSAYLGMVVKRHYIYSVGNGRFALILYYYTDREAADLADTVQKRFEGSWDITGTDTELTAAFLLVRVPETAKTATDIMYMAECPIPADMAGTIINDTSLDWMIRRAAVEKAVTRGLNENSFEVYYQPTYNADRTLHGAEALLRMNDSEIGMVYPDEFIPVAEQLGIIDRLDEFVLRDVCKFICTGIPKKNGMDCINMNLSVLECMKDGFAEYIIGIVESIGADKSMINFEITESVAAKDYERLASVISRLRREGFQFSIDDYGTGYSNMTSLFSLGVDIIKIDKSILWNAESSEPGMTLLKVSLELVHKMQKKALMEGVETESQLGILKALGCEYLQGYYFSKPLPKPNFVQLIEQKTVDAEAYAEEN